MCNPFPRAGRIANPSYQPVDRARQESHTGGDGRGGVYMTGGSAESAEGALRARSMTAARATRLERLIPGMDRRDAPRLLPGREGTHASIHYDAELGRPDGRWLPTRRRQV